MLDFLVFLLDIPSLLAAVSPRSRHEGESLYWRLMGIFLAAAELGVLLFWGVLENTAALVTSIVLCLWLMVHLVIRSSRNKEDRG